MTWYDNPGIQTSGPAAAANDDYVAVFTSTVKPKKGRGGTATDKKLYWGVRLIVRNGKIVGSVAGPITEEEYNKLTGKKPDKKKDDKKKDDKKKDPNNQGGT